MSIKSTTNKLTNIKIAKVLAQKFSAEKKFGQNFLTSTRHLYKLVGSAELNADDTVIEIGPGLGSVTEEILNHVNKVICFEIDPQKCKFLEEYFGDKIELVNQDFLEVDFGKFLQEREITKYKVLSSLPYNVSKPILTKLLSSQIPPSVISVIIQKEVGKDITAVHPDASFLGTYFRIWADIHSHGKVEAWNFYPKPKVDGIVLSFHVENKLNLSYEDRVKLGKFIKAGFLNPRKQLKSVLKSLYPNIGEAIVKLGFKETIRAQELDLEGWLKLWNEVKIVQI